MNDNSYAAADKSSSSDKEDDTSLLETQPTTELTALQPVLSEFETAVDESQTDFKLGEATLKSVKKEISVQLPILLEEKKLAVKERIF